MIHSDLILPPVENQQPPTAQTQVWLTLEQESNDQCVHVADDLHNQPHVSSPHMVVIVPRCHLDVQVGQNHAPVLCPQVQTSEPYHCFVLELVAVVALNDNKH